MIPLAASESISSENSIAAGAIPISATVWQHHTSGRRTDGLGQAEDFPRYILIEDRRIILIRTDDLFLLRHSGFLT